MGAPTPQVGVILQIFCRKLHENEGIWTPGDVPGAPLRSANADIFIYIYVMQTNSVALLGVQ